MTIPPPPPAAAQPQSSSAQAITALVLGILGIIPCCHLVAPIAWVLGYLERKAIREGRAPAAGDGIALVGMVLGIIGTIFLVVGTLWLLFWGGMAFLSALAHRHG
jgi:Domain of unknown function (DUF4190)